jgi:hypothetical protein
VSRNPLSIVLPFICVTLAAGVGCSIFYTRPTQEMADTQAAMRAAKEVQADSLSPEVYREASDWWTKAKHEYKLKNFQMAHDYADKARGLAEQAEFEAIRAGGVRQDPPDPLAQQAQRKYPPYPYPTPTGTPVEVYEQRRAEELKAQQQQSTSGSSTSAFPTTPPATTPTNPSTPLK